MDKHSWLLIAFGHPQSIHTSRIKFHGASGFHCYPLNLADFPELVAQYDTEKNDLSPSEIKAGSHRKVWWRCSEGHPRWYAVVASRTTGGHGCRYCSGNATAPEESLAAVFPEVARDLDIELNCTTPDLVAKYSNRIFWWRCSANPDHTWQKDVYHRTKKGSPCPKCKEERIGFLADRYPELAREFDVDLNGVTPDRVLANKSHKEYWWRCPEGPDHVWLAPLFVRIAGHGCGSCAGRQASVTNSLASLFPGVAEQFDSERNGVTPDEVVAGANSLYWWSCPAGPDHKWQATPNDRTSKRGGTGCPHCYRYEIVDGKPVSKQQRAIFELFTDSVINFSVGKRVVDLALPDEKIAIEYDSWFWHGDKPDEDRARVDEIVNLGWRVVSIKSNTEVPSRATIDDAMERLRQGENYVEIVSPDWGEGSTFKQAFHLGDRKDEETP